MRRTEPLNFNWYFAKKSDNLSVKDMEIVDIPHSNVIFPLTYINEKDYQFESVYQKHLQIDKNEQKRYFIEFDGVLHQASVYVNDIFVGKHLGGYTAFKFEITSQIISGDNWIKVDVDSNESLDFPPFGHVIDYLTYGGIYREVRLIETGYNYIEDIRIHTKNILIDPLIEIEVFTSGGQTLTATLIDSGRELIKSHAHVGSLLKINYPVQLWNLEDPKIYTLKITLDDQDSYEINTGFREAIFKNDGFYLNGKRLKISGLNRHQIYPHVGYAMPKSAQVMDARILKQTGNACRTSHYPQSQHFIDACDELGLLVFTEAPGWQYVGNEQWQENYKVQVQEMVRQYRHHPSIILFGTRVNESGDHSKLYEQTNQIAHTLSDQQTGGVRCFSFSEEIEDVYTYNDFIHNGDNTYLKPIDEVHSQHKPYLITEFNGHMFPTKTFDHSKRRLEHALRYAKIMNAYMGNPKITGAFGWQFIDYNTHKELGSSDRVCYHGVYDIFRLPKAAAKVYQSQVADKPYLEVLHGMDIGDYDQSYIDQMVVASNCTYIDLYQNERLVNRFFPNIKEYPHLKHPLYVINDFYGDAYEKDLGIKKEDAYAYMQLAHDVAKRGGLDKVLNDENMNWDKLNVAWKMYGKYVAHWGSGVFTYKLVGHYNNEKIIKYVGPYESHHYELGIDSPTLKIGDTYDVTRITIKATDNLSQDKPYCFDTFHLSTNDVIEIIGPKTIALIGGQYAFFIRSIKVGTGTLRIQNDLIDQILEIQVQ